MENWLLLFLGFGVGITGIMCGVFYFGDSKLYKQEQDLMDALRPPRDPWDVIAARCGYCNGKLSLMTDRCTHCGAPR